MKWTTDKPKETGWYWNRIEGGSAEIVLIHPDDDGDLAIGSKKVINGVLTDARKLKTHLPWSEEWSDETIPEPTN
jgi:hypothetical protein